jgi:hypothetical protein
MNLRAIVTCRTSLRTIGMLKMCRPNCDHVLLEPYRSQPGFTLPFHFTSSSPVVIGIDVEFHLKCFKGLLLSEWLRNIAEEAC